MGEAEATEMCNAEAFLDTIVALSDAVAANEHIAVLTLGELPDATRRQVSPPSLPRQRGRHKEVMCTRNGHC